MVLAPWVVVDVETTGMDAVRDAVIQVAAARSEEDGSLSVANWFVDPGRPIPAAIGRLTGFADVDFSQYPRLHQIHADIKSFLAGRWVVGHNIKFDQEFLERAGISCSQGVDTLEWARIAFPGERSYRLSDLMAERGFRFHDARDDVQATVALMQRIQRRLSRLPSSVKRDLARILGSEWDWWQAGEHDAHVPEAPLYRPQAEPQPSDRRLARFEAVPSPEQYLSPEGAIAQSVPNFEARPAQTQMAAAVLANWRAHGILMVEAGTGTGKSLAYLVPATLESARAGERVVVATNTLALQEQLWHKDWPTAGAGLPVQATMLKGKGRYLCLLKLDEVVNTASPMVDERAWRLAIAEALVYQATTERGDVEEWNPRGDEARRLKDAIITDRNACRGPQCVFAGPCFMRQAKRSAESSHVLIINHALLAAHLAQGGVLPEFQHVIIDEAHRFAEVVERSFGFDLTLREWAREGKEMDRTLIPVLMDQARAGHPELVAALDRLRIELNQTFTVALELSRVLAEELHFDDYPQQSVRITEAVWTKWGANGVRAQLTALTDEAHLVLGLGRDILAEVEAIWGDASEEEVSWLRYRKWLEEITEIDYGLSAFGIPDSEWVSWFEGHLRKDEVAIRLRRGPVSVSDIIGDRLWSKVNSAALTSATLSVGGRFEYLEEMLGVPADRARHLVLPSPFDLKRQARLVVPSSLAPVDSSEHLQQMADFVVEAAVRLNGRTLVLLNSYRTLKQLDQKVRERLQSQGIATLAQGIDGTGPGLVERFRDHPGSILLGVASLWEGVDVAGDALSLVIIGRLPFATPGDPIEEARLERIRAEGGLPFYRRTLPQAVLKFQQGFGRLIRRRSDRGAVAVLDSRILPGQTRYGHQFIRAVQPVPLVVGDVQSIFAEIGAVVAVKEI